MQDDDPRIRLDPLNAASRTQFVAMLSGVVESALWVVEAAGARRPFTCVEALSSALETGIRDAGEQAQLALIRTHPELAGAEARSGEMTAESNSEQGRLGLLALDAEDHARLTRLNVTYRERFGFPFMIALDTVPDLAAVFEAFERRLNASPDAERGAAIDQIVAVMRGRVRRLVAEPATGERATATP